MRYKIEELESKIRRLLPNGATLEADPTILELTRELIQEGDYARNTASYIHSVCHLFEKYGVENNTSYLNSTELFPVAEELVTYTLKKAMNSGIYSSVSRIVLPIMKLNLTHSDETPGGFTFKPTILSDPKFIHGLSQDTEIKRMPYLLAFCNSNSIEEFVEIINEMQKLGGPISNPTSILPGVFIDVDGTLIEYESHDSKRQKANYKIFVRTQEYALRKMEEGIPVTVFTGADLEDAVEKLKIAGVDERLHDVKSKEEYLGRWLETCVDDTVPSMQGFRAMIHYKSGKCALDAEYSD